MEGAAFSLEHNLKVAESIGVEVGELLAMGGAANSQVWVQIKADITGKTMKIPASDTATTLGAAILAGVGVGLYGSFEEAVKKTISITRVQEPDLKRHEMYQKAFQKYLALSEHMQKFWKADR